jgi:hypothetical protein
LDVALDSEELLALPDTQSISIIDYTPPQVENLLSLLDTTSKAIEVSLDSGVDLLSYLDTQPKDIEVSEFIHPDDIIAFASLRDSNVTDNDLIHAFTIIELTANNFIYSSLTNDLIYNFVPLNTYDEGFIYNFNHSQYTDDGLVYNLTFNNNQEVQPESLTLLFNYIFNPKYTSGDAEGLLFSYMTGDYAGNEVTNESQGLLFNFGMSTVSYQTVEGLMYSFTFNDNKMATDLPLQFL